MTTIMREKKPRAFLSASHSNLITDMPNTHFLVASVVLIMVRNRPEIISTVRGCIYQPYESDKAVR